VQIKNGTYKVINQNGAWLRLLPSESAIIVCELLCGTRGEFTEYNLFGDQNNEGWLFLNSTDKHVRGYIKLSDVVVIENLQELIALQPITWLNIRSAPSRHAPICRTVNRNNILYTLYQKINTSQSANKTMNGKESSTPVTKTNWILLCDSKGDPMENAEYVDGRYVKRLQ
jgi:hypothetical protein